MEPAVALTPTQWQVSGLGTDIDSAWDDAKTRALAAWGAGFVGVALYAEDFIVTELVQPESAVLRSLGEVSAPQAYPVSSARDWVGRRARVVITDTAVTLPDVVSGPVALQMSPVLDKAIIDLLAEQGKALQEGELLLSTTLTSIRRRAKVGVIRNRAPSQRRFVIVSGDKILGVEMTSKEAVARSKGLAVVHGECDVWVLSGREGEKALVEVRQTITSQRAVVTVLLSRQKKPDKNRIASWVFIGPRDLMSVSSENDGGVSIGPDEQE